LCSMNSNIYIYIYICFGSFLRSHLQAELLKTYLYNWQCFVEYEISYWIFFRILVKVNVGIAIV